MRWNQVLVAACAVCLVGLAVPARGEHAPLVHQGIIEAPVADVWHAFTTKEGLESWMVAHAEMDLRIGGKMRSVYDPNGVLGDESTIENTIISFQPQRMLSFRNTLAPKNFPFKDAIANTWSVLLFEEVSPQRTRLTITGMGYGDDEQSLKMREFFNAGNQWTLEKLQQKFAANAPSTDDAQTTLQTLHKLAGGDWIFENTRPDGSIFRTRSVYEIGPDKQSLTARGWLGSQNGMYVHGVTQVWREPRASGQPHDVIRFQNIDENGSLARGEIHSAGENKITWDWSVTTLAGKSQKYRVEMTLEDEDHVRFVLFHLPPEGELKELVNLVYTRVADAPPQFHVLQAK